MKTSITLIISLNARINIIINIELYVTLENIQSQFQAVLMDEKINIVLWEWAYIFYDKI